MNKLQEKFLLLQIQRQQDADSFTKVYELLFDPLYRFIYFKVSDEEVAKDITAEVFLKCWRDLTKAGSSDVKHLRAYFYTVARHMVIDFYRSREQGTEAGTLPFGQVKNEPVTDSMRTTVEQSVDSRRVMEVIKRLKISYQEVLVLRYVEGLSLSEIAHVIGKTPVATRVLLHRANAALKREYEQSSQTNP
ncbi:MAG: sigma-70 family RNA polymerase sigma factor [Parcubacteria group bacterium]|nr:sigma-70 family RNA polymerase sigma factor [Parcubacteria group bacterium]